METIIIHLPMLAGNSPITEEGLKSPESCSGLTRDGLIEDLMDIRASINSLLEDLATLIDKLGGYE